MRSPIAALILLAGSLTLASIALPAHALEDLGDEDGGGGASGRRFGLGVILGAPTALSGKLFIDGTSAVQLHVGWAFTRRGRLVLIADYLFHIQGVIPPIERAGRLTPYVGIGGRIGIHEDDRALLGARVPLGLSFMINNVPLEVFVEFAFGIGLVPETVLILDGGLGVRYYF